jgi:16S rRNA (guanine527-N7)-methyltransferase
VSEANVKQPKVAAGGAPVEELVAGCAALGLPLSDEARDKLLAYVALLTKWNRTYNLTAVRDPGEMVSQHLLDSLAVLPHLTPDMDLADVGSGAGLPGLPLAIMRPALRLTSIEANRKKAAFQQQAKIELKLDNANIKCCRVEALAPGLFDAVISRAFADLAEFARLAGGVLKPDGRLLAMKGMRPDAELAALPAPWRATAVRKLQVPGLAAQRHLIVLERE